MQGYELRAVTLHLGVLDPDDDLEAAIENASSRLLEAVDAAASAVGVRPTYVRLALPRSEGDRLREVSRASERIGKDVLINAGQVYVSELTAVLGEALRAGVYASVLLTSPSWEEAKQVSEFVHSIASDDPEAATRVGVNVFGERWFLTPYYPLASAVPGRNIVSVALTYPGLLLEAFRRSGIKGVSDAIRFAASEALRFASEVVRAGGYELGGVDLSVSPWMEESSLALVEAVSGVRMPRPGFTSGVRAVNQAIEETSRGLKVVGFNEVMLPVGEDSKLKARASEGEVTARYLAMLSGVCVAGLDMVAVPASINDVAGLILDVASYSAAKRRPLGVRVIPVEAAEPGDKVALGRFGEVPVIPI